MTSKAYREMTVDLKNSLNQNTITCNDKNWKRFNMQFVALRKCSLSNEPNLRVSIILLRLNCGILLFHKCSSHLMTVVCLPLTVFKVRSIVCINSYVYRSSFARTCASSTLLVLDLWLMAAAFWVISFKVKSVKIVELIRSRIAFTVSL